MTGYAESHHPDGEGARALLRRVSLRRVRASPHRCPPAPRRATLGSMTPDATPEPGSLTVPPLFGWKGIAVLLVAALVIGVGYLVLSALSAGRQTSADWDEWLQGRSRNRYDAVDGADLPRPGPSPDRSGVHPGAHRTG